MSFYISKLQQLIKAEEAFQQCLSEVKFHYKQSLIDQFVRSKDPKLYQYVKSITKSNSLPSVLSIILPQLILIWTRPMYLMNISTQFILIVLQLYLIYLNLS